MTISGHLCGRQWAVPRGRRHLLAPTPYDGGMMSADPQLSKILDEYEILRHAWTRRGMWLEEVEALHQRIIDVYSRRTPIPAREDKIRVCFNFRAFRGWAMVAASTATVTDGVADRANDAYPGDGSTWTYMRPYFVGALLYADQVVDQDPLSFEKYFGSDGAFGRLPWALSELRLVQPLIESGILILAPIPPNQTAAETEDKEYLEKWEEYVRRTGEPSDFRGLSGAAAFDGRYFRDALATAKGADATLVPRNDFERRYLEFLGSSSAVSSVSGSAVRVITGLSSVDLPLFAGIPAELVVKIRKDEDAFADWRAQLRRVIHVIRTECTEEGFVEEAREVFDDLVQPAARAVRRATSRSAALKAVAREQPLRLALGAGFGLAMASTLGLPPLGSVASSVAGALANLSYAGLSPNKASGVSPIISMLVKHRGES